MTKLVAYLGIENGQKVHTYAIYLLMTYSFNLPKIPLLHRCIENKNWFTRFHFSLIYVPLFINLILDIGSRRAEAAAQARISIFNF